MPPKLSLPKAKLGSPPRKLPRQPRSGAPSSPIPFSPVLSPVNDPDFGETGPQADYPSLSTRPLPPPISSSNDFIFQLISMSEPQESHVTVPYVHRDDYPSYNISSFVTAFGVTPEGNSVSVRLHGYRPYIYIKCPDDFNDSESGIQQTIEQINSACNRDLRNPQSFVLDIKVVERMSIMNYEANPITKFLQFTLTCSRSISKVRGILETGRFGSGPLPVCNFETFDSNINYSLQMRLMLELADFEWVKLGKGSFTVQNANENSKSQIIIDCSWRSVSVINDNHLPPYAPIRIMSLDIEVAGRQGVFPTSEVDPIIQIAVACQIGMGLDDQTSLFKVVFVHGSCLPIAGVSVRSHQSERDLLIDFERFLLVFDPDVITGYNSEGFDVPYIIDRGRHKSMKIPNYFNVSRLNDALPKYRDTRFSSNQVGTRETKHTEIPGRIVIDVLHSIQTDHKLRSYTLNSVSLHFLGEQKEDVHHSAITGLFKGSADDRRRLAVYCVKDALLPLRLINHLKLLVNLSEMAKVTGVGVDSLLGRGQQIKVLAQIYHYSMKRGFVIPNVPKREGGDESYEGATVIEPLKGYHENAISVLDFSSLYPSIMMAHNVCYSTLIRQTELKNFDAETYTIVPTESDSTIAFIKKENRIGILPEILNHLLTARKEAKRLMASSTDKSLQAVYDGRQLALKITANSVYGFTGALVGKLPCPEIAASVTAFGRTMIDKTKSLVESSYDGAKVVYGDTDSVMIDFGVKEVSRSIEMGHEAAEFITSHFEKPISLEFEKVYCPYLLISKKRYAGLLWKTADNWSKIDAKGIETVRRDNCPLVAKVVTTCLNKILIDRDPTGAMRYAQSIISDLLQNKLDLSLLVISKQLTKDESNYANVQPHTECAKKMAKRDPGSAPTIGSRVAYVIIQGSKNSKIYERAEDPIYVLENNLSLDTDYYLTNQLSNPLVRIFEPINKKAESELLHGSHTRKVSRSFGGTSGLMKFAKAVPTCLGCKARLTSQEVSSKSPLCQHCGDKKEEIIRGSLENFRKVEHAFSRIWTECQRCAGNMHQKVLCESRDCPIFYLRKKVQKDYLQAEQNLKKFGNFEW
ncbi:hypothetical protein P9112_013744 [Eukaryota sp. TZLM1-RC]